MAGFVALLGSVNVGGNRLPMAELRSLLGGIGLDAVRTVTASGNVLFDAEEAEDALCERITDAVAARFGFRPFVAIRSRGQLDAVIAENPFAASGLENLVHSVFLNKPYDRATFTAFAASYAGPERLAAGEGCYHVDFVSGAGRSTLGRDLARAKIFAEPGTARNIRSMRRIAEAMAA